MRLDVLLFASAADAFGAARLAVELPDGATADDVRRRVLTDAAARGAALPDSTRVAVNRAIAAPGAAVRPEDEIAVIPPVAGG